MSDKKTKSRVSLKNLGPVAWYPFLFAAYSVLGLLANNLTEARPAAGIRPLALVLLGSGILFGLLRLLLRDGYRAAFVTAAWLLLFAVYGHVYFYVRAKEPVILRTYLLEGAALLLAAAAVFAATRPKVRMEAWAAPLNVAALVLVVFSLWQIARSEIEHRAFPAEARETPVETTAGGSYPDIYYIILDSYTRADTLAAAYGYDNSAFLSDLEALGFDAAECSMSNYRHTKLSLVSAFNMAYVDGDLDPRITPGGMADAPMWNLIRSSAAMKYLQARGYRTAAFATGAPWSEWDHADAYFAPDQSLSDFEILFLETTAFKALEKSGRINLHELSSEHYRERTSLALETLPALPEMDLGGPKFVFAHIIPPHSPFVFAEDGSPVADSSFLNKRGEYSPAQYAAGYTMQTTFINNEMLRILREIISKSERPPVIILQGDHGPWFLDIENGLTILNAYYLPGRAAAIPETITPVNTFRLVFDLYFGDNFDLLPDQSYYSPVPARYDFEPIPNRCKAGSSAK